MTTTYLEIPVTDEQLASKPIKKPTLATVKSFINKNRENLFINVKSSFDGMTDGVESLRGGFAPAKKDKTVSVNSDYYNATQGIEGVWFVGGSRDYVSRYDENGFVGYTVCNSCGAFILAIKSY